MAFVTDNSSQDLLYSDVLVSRSQANSETIWPVSVQNVKDNAQIVHDSDDRLLNDGNDGGLIASAVAFVEELGRVALITQTRRLKFDYGFPEIIYPPVGPLLTVSSITYLDEDYASQTVSSSTYRVDTGTVPGRVKCKSGYSWPSTVQDIAAGTVNYTCGFGTSPAGVPAVWKKPIIALATYWWEHRENYDAQFVNQAFLDVLQKMVDVAGRQVRYT